MGAVYHVEKLLVWYFWYSAATVIFEMVYAGSQFSTGGSCAPKPSPFHKLTGVPVFVCGVADGASVLLSVLMVLASFYFLYVIWLVKELVRKTSKLPGLLRFYEPWSVAAECSSLTQDPPPVSGSHGPYHPLSSRPAEMLAPTSSITYQSVPASGMVRQVSPPRPQPAAAMPSWAPMVRIPVPSQVQAPQARLPAGMPSWTINSWNEVPQGTMFSAFPQSSMVPAPQSMVPVPQLSLTAAPQIQAHSPKSEPAPRSQLPLQTVGAIPSRARSTSPAPVITSTAVPRSSPAMRPATTQSIVPSTTPSIGPTTPPPAVARSLSPVRNRQPSLDPIVVSRPRSLSPGGPVRLD